MNATADTHSPPPATVLVVDDQPANLGLLFAVLGGAGLRVLVAEDGASALAQLEHETPDLILLDVVMPGLDGFATCERLKAEARLRDVPVLFMTAQHELTDRLRGFAVGGADYITKPFLDEEVLARVRAHLGLRALQQRLEQRAAELAEEVERRVAAEAQLASSLDRAVVVLGDDGRVEFATELARLVCARWLGASSAGELPGPLRGWVLARRRGEPGAEETFAFRANGGGLHARLVAASGAAGAMGTALLLLEERIDASPLALRELGLTAREAEVLFWLAQGKTYREIGVILACAWRTAQTHAERIFAKLGVENRHAAAALARPLLEAGGGVAR